MRKKKKAQNESYGSIYTSWVGGTGKQILSIGESDGLNSFDIFKYWLICFRKDFVY